MTTYQLSQNIKNHAIALGFGACGFARAERLDEEAVYLEKWLNQQHHGEMQYLENHFEKRVNPTELVEGAKTVISLSYNYFTHKKQHDPAAPKLAMYALGRDYHDVVKEKLEQLLAYIKTQTTVQHARCFVDSAPVLERAWAQRAGIGWVGKNTLLLTKRQGSYFFLAEIILDVELIYDSPVKNYCGSCTKCIDACPTKALHKPYQMDASKCISYYTIELKGETLPTERQAQFQNWMFGCDICQQVCPINAQAQEHNEPLFQPNEELLRMTRPDWENLSEERFKSLFRYSAVKRAKYKGLKRNIDFLRKR